ncbi:hypothetical protein DQ384_16980 [Sphaerisporangium album]|uniref:Uncharacterized protein n=1 Tax=Sphaerisporangium album TaxID=509200 RepID=A0A367FHL5_9ACTN|nr:hypothetical protein [Sphaerisporangium album]RCG29868.1 hypothetical protein DQ384_16980 [Sphaerisporangium album]
MEPDSSSAPIDWQPATQAEDRRRVLRWTCECRPVVYYLITAGGQGYIERTDPGHTTVQSPRLRYAQIADLWEQLLLGRAR